MFLERDNIVVHVNFSVKLLGEHVGVFENIHLVGHSLGAHVVGFIAKEVKKMGLGKVSRMTGLDPAFPFFELQGPEGRIDKSDAEFVQIVHTNSGFLWEGCLSFKEPLGIDKFILQGKKVHNFYGLFLQTTNSLLIYKIKEC